MRSAGSIIRPLAALLLLQAARAVADGPIVTGLASVLWEDNATNAPAGDGVLGAFTVGAAADAKWIHSIDFSTLVSLDLSATAGENTRFSGLDSLSVCPQLALWHRLGVGAYAPSLSVGIGGSLCGYRESERSKAEADFSIGYSQRFTDSLQLLLDGQLGSYDARDIVFCGNFASLSATLNWDIDEDWRVKLMGGWRAGDVVSGYTAQESPEGWIPVDSGAFANPGAWHYVPTFGTPYVDWRVEARTLYGGIGVAPALGAHTSLVLQVVRYSTRAYDLYVNDVVSASIVHHF